MRLDNTNLMTNVSSEICPENIHLTAMNTMQNFNFTTIMLTQSNIESIQHLLYPLSNSCGSSG